MYLTSETTQYIFGIKFHHICLYFRIIHLLIWLFSYLYLFVDRSLILLCFVSIYRYNPENVGKLERYLEFQVESGSYHFEANLTLIKL